MDSKKYNNIKLGFGIAKTIISFIIIFLFVATGLSRALVEFINQYLSNDYLVLIAFVFISGIAISTLFAPANFYSSFILEHKFNLSNQTFFAWLKENVKSSLVGGAIGFPLLLLFY
jgi:STE24 endopeptidase